MVGPVAVALVLGLLAAVTAIIALIVSIVWPEHRFWPPGTVSWQFWFIWGNWMVVLVSLSVVAYRTAGTFVFGRPVWTIGGLSLILAGILLWSWAGYTFRIQESLGLSGELRTGGPYQFTRNPQNVGMFATVVGLLFIVNSFAFSIGMLPVFVWLLLSPVAEEPWLHNEFGEAYDQYRDEVPRLIGWTSVERLIGEIT